MNIRSDIELANASDIGCVRSANEDYYLFIEPQDDEEFRRRGRLILVADGMGGHKGGRMASRLAGDTIRDVFLSSSEEDPLEVMREGFSKAHLAIADRAAADPELAGMGTTCTAIILRALHLTLGHIGDSRLYLIRDGSPQQVSRDHTVVNRMVEEGRLTPEQAQNHEKRHVLCAALGVGSDDDVDFAQDPVEIHAGDILLLCSDGLHGLISAEEMASVTIDQPLESACSELLAWARVRGGPDNITLQLVRLAAAAQNV